MGNKATPVKSDGFWWDKDIESSSFQIFSKNIIKSKLEKGK